MKRSLRSVMDENVLQVLVSSFIVAGACKVLLFPAYRSTDFLVHRHWKSLTREFPVQEWYHDNVDTFHTLDYPPGFAFFEEFLGNNRLTNLLLQGWVDGKCLQTWSDGEIENDPSLLHSSCINFMRSTVIMSDIGLWVGSWALASSFPSSRRWPMFFALVFHPALLWLDHVHFQYNGMLLGLLMASIACLLRGNGVKDGSKLFHFFHLAGAAIFASLLTMKHLYLTLSLWYFSYLLRRYCFVNEKFSALRFLSLGLISLACLILPFLTWIFAPNAKEELQQIGSRLFPFGRGLVHDYWAGNFWCFFEAARKLVRMALGISLHSPTPLTVAGTTVVSLIPGAIHAYMSAARRSNNKLLLSLAYSAMASFMFGFHVHEKAIVTTLVPMTALAFGCDSCKTFFWEINAFSLLGLSPLLFHSTELSLKCSTFAAYCTAASFSGESSNRLPRVRLICLGIIIFVIAVVEMVPMEMFGRYEFLPLALNSLVTACGLSVSFGCLALEMQKSS